MSSSSGQASDKSIAIIGMSCIFPGAPSLKSFWHNILSAVDSIREASAEEWDSEKYRQKDSGGFGKIYCSKGGFITEHAYFDPLEFGIMPSSLNGSDPDQFLCLKVAADALADAGYNPKTFSCQKGDVIIGRTAAPGIGSMNLIQHGQTIDQVLSVLRKTAPHLSEETYEGIEEALHASLRPCNADTIPGVMPNIVSGRIASKLGFYGRNLTLDAACASSLSAVELAIEGLLSSQTDLAIVGGVHINSSPYFYQMFCGLSALSKEGIIRPFDDSADGTMLGEGVGMVVLQRLADAEKEGKRIYATIKGIGFSSDGRGGSSLAPSIEGETLAMRRAYEMAGVSPSSVELVEAHGTGTKAGDLAEIKALEQVFKSENGMTAWCALGSVKSNIGHTQAASGMAGLIKAALSVYFKQIPPTLHVSKPNAQIDWSKSPCYINSTLKEWKAPPGGNPRRAAISAFGFGGVNAHAVLEEYTTGPNSELADPPVSSKALKMNLRFPELKLDNYEARKLPHFLKPVEKVKQRTAKISSDQARNHSRQQFAGPPPSASSEQPSAAADSSEEPVLAQYFQSMSSFHQSLLNSQESVLKTYLESPDDADSI